MRDEQGLSIKRLVRQYLVENNIAKVACLTNCLPGERGAQWPLEDFNYLSFCMFDEGAVSEALYQAFRHGYRSAEFDVSSGRLEAGLVARQFGYLCLRFPTTVRAHSVFQFISENKESVNRRSPILLRILCEDVANLELPDGCEIKTTRAPNDVVFEVTT